MSAICNSFHHISTVVTTVLFLFLICEKVVSIGICANDTSIYCNENCTSLMTMFSKENDISSWNKRHPHIAKAYQNHKIKIAVEIGVARGGLSHYLLTHVPDIQEYHGVDPFLGGYDNTDAMSNILQSANSSLTWSHAVMKSLSSFGCKFRMHYGFSHDAIPAFRENSVDAVFIDGDHTLNGANRDIRLWSPIVKPGGMIMFDDYDSHYPGVIEAVDEFVSKNKLRIHDIKNANVFVIKPPYPLILPDTHTGLPPTHTATEVVVGNFTNAASVATSREPGVAELLKENAVLKDRIRDIEKKVKRPPPSSIQAGTAPTTTATAVLAVDSKSALSSTTSAEPGVAELLKENAVLKDRIKELEKKVRPTAQSNPRLRRRV